MPSRDAGDMRTTFHLMDDATPSTPSKTRIIPTESDALKEQANSIFNTILHTEVTPASPQRPGSPVRPPAASTTNLPTTPTRRRLFAFNSPSRSNPATPSRRLDMPTDEAYSLSPVRAESRQLLESPRRQVRSVCKTPYRVLDAPELADDFYLNLVDWSSTNVLGVGLGSCVYLWTAHTAQVSKLCDLNNLHDTISSVSWVQKVCEALRTPTNTATAANHLKRPYLCSPIVRHFWSFEQSRHLPPVLAFALPMVAVGAFLDGGLGWWLGFLTARCHFLFDMLW